MAPKKKVLQVIRPSEGGIGKHVLLLAEGLKDDFDVTVACPQGSSLEDNFLAKKIKILALPLKGIISLKDDFASFKILSNFMRGERVNLVHAHGAKAALIARPAALWSGVPASVYTVHNSIINPKWPSWKNRIAAAIERALSSSTDCIITVSRALCEEIITQENIPRSKIKVIHNGIDFNEFDYSDNQTTKDKWGIPHHRTVIGTVARMAPQKGLPVLINAAKQIIDKYDLHFLIAGDGPLRASLQEQVHSAGMQDFFTFTGAVKNVAQVYQVMDIFVLPSITEGLPLTILEAMSFGLPVIASAVGGIPELIINNETGLLIPPGNDDELALKIAYLVEFPGKKYELGGKARQLVLNNFAVENMIKKTINLYDNLLHESALKI
ncbi:glycosyltransferase family 4 protein [Desulfotruncus alcoholivorax]|uniref:glycosyltransferase family 4 protein n=1 Tax=Desulfotruncus alcoholivorax TaxID=265477 RepID=UPI0004028534|nr:glycosyltransferase family 4 protein [Desulfotruncus alcoholivorax]